ncbi:serpin-ZX-like [Cucurbita moschata]|uniref:Serpin-ZX-like n=1 Tax=Cucurbita moschata TaxID=3662 RepID=A0A6J1HF48_CUCMO|nr:serpin-ZX-like [Cucurbita moschata]
MYALPKTKMDQRFHVLMMEALYGEKAKTPTLIEKLDPEPGFIDRHIPYEKREVEKFMIPKFKISFGVELTEALKGLGLTLPFHGGFVTHGMYTYGHGKKRLIVGVYVDDLIITGGDVGVLGSFKKAMSKNFEMSDLESTGLTEMVEPQVGAEDPFVSVILQKSFIEVNEQGTDAAAVSVSRMLGRCPSDLTVRIDFVADHPFLYVLRENTTGTLLFVGQLLNPLVSK